MPPPLSSYRIGSIYTIRFKIVYLDYFSPYHVKSGDRAQLALDAKFSEVANNLAQFLPQSV